MTLAEFRLRVLEEFGRGLERTTYASVHGFCARLREEVFPSRREGKTYVLDDDAPTPSWDDAMASYFEAALALDPDRAAISLWLHAFETWYAERDETDERFAELLGDADEEPYDDPGRGRDPV